METIPQLLKELKHPKVVVSKWDLFYSYLPYPDYPETREYEFPFASWLVNDYFDISSLLRRNSEEAQAFKLKLFEELLDIYERIEPGTISFLKWHTQLELNTPYFIIERKKVIFDESVSSREDFENGRYDFQRTSLGLIYKPFQKIPKTWVLDNSPAPGINKILLQYIKEFFERPGIIAKAEGKNSVNNPQILRFKAKPSHESKLKLIYDHLTEEGYLIQNQSNLYSFLRIFYEDRPEPEDKLIWQKDEIQSLACMLFAIPQTIDVYNRKYRIGAEHFLIPGRQLTNTNLAQGSKPQAQKKYQELISFIQKQLL